MSSLSVDSLSSPFLPPAYPNNRLWHRQAHGQPDGPTLDMRNLTVLPLAVSSNGSLDRVAILATAGTRKVTTNSGYLGSESHLVESASGSDSKCIEAPTEPQSPLTKASTAFRAALQ
eukprot:575979-Amphidinium_carterae.1